MLLVPSLAIADDANAKQIEFFEKRIRPVLVEHCYACHNSNDTADGGLILDHAEAMREGGDGGAIIVPLKPEESRLLPILQHEVDGLAMPAEAPKLDDDVIADFARWIKAGAVDPRDEAPSSEQVEATLSWDATMKRRQQWWSLQPITNPEPPSLASLQTHAPKDFTQTLSDQPIDRFVLEKTFAAGLQPVAPASAPVLVRRLYFSLTGLPPDPEALSMWSERLQTSDGELDPQAIDELIDHLLESPHYGERWARHWMDWLRYAESHGSEGDPLIDQAWRWRDYMVRGLNQDVPVDQLIREHIAGDLLTSPRTSANGEINESAIGPAHWRMVFHGFTPTDAYDERVRFTDDQINTVSKAYLGLTVSCARCHNHKFDAISQQDYHAFFSILASCRPGRTAIETETHLNAKSNELSELKTQIRKAIASDWLKDLSVTPAQLKTLPWHAAFAQQTAAAAPDTEPAIAEHLQQLQNDLRSQQEQWAAFTSAAGDSFMDTAACATWTATGNGLSAGLDSTDAILGPAGQFSLTTEGEQGIRLISPAAILSDRLSDKHAARLTSADFLAEPNSELWVLAQGTGGAAVRFVVRDYPRIGTVYPIQNLNPEWTWHRFDLSYWAGDTIHIELAAAQDAPLLVKPNLRSAIGIRAAAIVPKGSPAPPVIAPIQSILSSAAESSATTWQQLADQYQHGLRQAIEAWSNETLTNDQALLLETARKHGLVSNEIQRLSTAGPLLTQYREIENQVPVPTRVPSLEEAGGSDAPLFIRGDHKQPSDVVPRRFLEAIDGTPYETQLSGRLELADDLLRSDNPLTRRVFVNRIWHHLFGQGLVATPDNFGRVGASPSHPELLDWLAVQLTENDWSLKQLIRQIVRSKTWQLSSQTPPETFVIDPENRWLSHANVRRLEAESIRDSLLNISDSLIPTVSGAPVSGETPRRSIYVQVIRNNLDPFLRVFDFPEPFSAVGRRDATNIPAQSLTMLNAPLVAQTAESWARKIQQDEPVESKRISRMFQQAFSRLPSDQETQWAIQYLKETKQRLHVRDEQRQRLQEKQDGYKKRLQELNNQVIARILNQRGEAPQETKIDIPPPIETWAFSNQLSVGRPNESALPNVEIKGGASLDEKGLTVRDQGYALSQPITKTLTAKTLLAWVQLDNLAQQAGGVFSIQSKSGDVFDAIVYGERIPGQWLAGSNSFARTQFFTGPEETEADKQPVQIAISYHADGQVMGYRNGKLYGSPYKSNGPQTFAANETIVSFGLRHLPATGNRFLSGKILRAELYDYALSAPQVAMTMTALPSYVSDSELQAAMTDEETQQLAQLTASAEQIKAELEPFEKLPNPIDANANWTELAHALLTAKEFIYVR